MKCYPVTTSRWPEVWRGLWIYEKTVCCSPNWRITLGRGSLWSCCVKSVKSIRKHPHERALFFIRSAAHRGDDYISLFIFFPCENQLQSSVPCSACVFFLGHQISQNVKCAFIAHGCVLLWLNLEVRPVWMNYYFLEKWHSSAPKTMGSKLNLGAYTQQGTAEIVKNEETKNQWLP